MPGMSQAVRSSYDGLYQQLVELPENMVGQIIDGELVALPRPAVAHSRLATRLAATLSLPFDMGVRGPGGWHLLFEPELHLDHDVLVPDLAGWRVDEAPEGLMKATAVSAAPQWVCEVLSPSTARLDRTRKMRIYAREGVKNVWLADPIEGTLEVFTRENEGWHVHLIDADEMDVSEIRLAPFDAVPLDLRPLWDRPPREN